MSTTLDQLLPISLSELQSDAALLTRFDRKYLVPFDQVGELLAGIDRDTRVLEIDGRRAFGYLTPYFDDDCHSSYMGAARQRPNRFKVRTRLYTDSGICLLEVKVRDSRGRTIKYRADHDAGTLGWLDSSERAWLASFPQVAPFADALVHCLTTRYQRTTLVLQDGTGRITIDRDLMFALPNGQTRTLDRYIVIETKSERGLLPFDRQLWRAGYRPMSMSKFASGLSLLVPQLPANRWNRVRKQLDAASVGARSDASQPRAISSGEGVLREPDWESSTPNWRHLWVTHSR